MRTAQENFRMPKALCISGMVISILIFIVFFIDFLMGLIGFGLYAPFKNANTMMDIIFFVGAAILGYLSWSTWKDQV